MTSGTVTLTASQRRLLALLCAGDIPDPRVTLSEGKALYMLHYLQALHYAVLLTSSSALDWKWRITGAGQRYLAETGWLQS